MGGAGRREKRFLFTFPTKDPDTALLTALAINVPI